MNKGEFYTYWQVDDKKVARKKQGYIDRKKEVGYYREERPLFTDRWHAVDLKTGMSITWVQYRKNLGLALDEEWDKFIEYQKTPEYKRQCEEFAEKIAEQSPSHHEQGERKGAV